MMDGWICIGGGEKGSVEVGDYLGWVFLALY